MIDRACGDGLEVGVANGEHETERAMRSMVRSWPQQPQIKRVHSVRSRIASDQRRKYVVLEAEHAAQDSKRSTGAENVDRGHPDEATARSFLEIRRSFSVRSQSASVHMKQCVAQQSTVCSWLDKMVIDELSDATKTTTTPRHPSSMNIHGAQEMSSAITPGRQVQPQLRSFSTSAWSAPTTIHPKPHVGPPSKVYSWAGKETGRQSQTPTH